MFGFARKLAKKAEGFIAPGIDEGVSYGFRVLHVEPDSEAFHAGLEPLFDFVTAVNGQRFDKPRFEHAEGHLVAVEQEQCPYEDFELAVGDTKERLVLEVWSSKGKVARTVLLPNPAKQAHGLGFEVQWCPVSAGDQVWHILEIRPQSPAAQAGLVSHSDYIIAAANGELEAAAAAGSGEQALARVITQAKGRREGVLFYVYNREFDVVRPVRVTPTPDGKLGCGVGYGLLHALPKTAGSQGPGMLFDSDEQKPSSEPLQPVQNLVPTLDSQPVSAPPTSAGGLAGSVYVPHKHHKSARTQSTQLSDYFEEQSRISHEIDGSGNQSAGAAAPPPPKRDDSSHSETTAA